MRKLMLWVSILLCLSALPAQAETLLGKNYIGGSFGVTKFGDDILDKIFGNGYHLNATGNINLNTNIDFLANAEYLWADGDVGSIEVDLSGIIASGKIIYFSKTDEKINPFLGAGIMILKNKVEASAFGLMEEKDETDLGIVLDAGIEFESTEKALFRFNIDYFRVNGLESTDAIASFGYWFNKVIIGLIEGTYDFDHGNVTAQVGLAIRR